MPSRVITNDFFVARNPLCPYDARGQKVLDDKGAPKLVDTSDEKIQELMGIQKRHWVEDGQYNHHLSAAAANKALKAASLAPNDLEGIVVATVTAKHIYPNTAQLVQEMIGARSASYCTDTNAACAGFPYVLDVARNKIERKGGYWLVIATETLSRVTDLTDVNSPLFADGAGAVILGPSEERKGLLHFFSRSDPFEGRWEYIIRDEQGMLRMPRGQQVMSEAVRRMVESVHAIKKESGWTDHDIDLMIPHQANKRILESMRKKLGFDPERVFDNIKDYGNMSSATCAVGLAQCLESGRIRPGHKVIITTFGAGLTTSAYGIQF